MVLKITNDKWENNDIEVIVDSVNALWLNEKNMEEKLGHKNLPVAVAHTISTPWRTFYET